ncbi:DUF4221 family protein [Algoriphagus sp.]|uniref:DUF4221 family protein n=1 Tax=Algoriphagus sp. TaxID=1872435 RepID=UPI0039190BAD
MKIFKIKISIYLLFFVLLAACKESKTTLLEQIKPFKIGESNLVLDDTTSIDFMRISYVEQGENEYLLHQNEFKKVIQVFDLNTGFVNHEIQYPFEQPLGIKVVQGITAISLDSIFIFMPMSIRGSILINRQGEIINRYMPSKEENLEKSLINHVSFGAMSTMLEKGNLRFIQLPLFEVTNPANINEDFKFEVLYNLESNEIFKESSSGFPEFYQNKIWPSQDISIARTIDKYGRVVYSWRFLHSLIVEKDGIVEEKLAKSDFIDEEFTPFSMIPDKDQNMEKIIQTAKYYGVYYDKYRDLFYRTVQHSGIYNKNEIPKEMDGVRNFSVIVLDSDFNKIKEITFPGGIYNIYRAFVGKRGFYLPKNNVMNPDLVENILSIDIFDFTAND